MADSKSHSVFMSIPHSAAKSSKTHIQSARRTFKPDAPKISYHSYAMRPMTQTWRVQSPACFSFSRRYRYVDEQDGDRGAGAGGFNDHRRGGAGFWGTTKKGEHVSPSK